MACLIILGILNKIKKKNTKVSELISTISKYANSGEINFKIENKNEAMVAVKDYFLNKEKVLEMFDFDGYRLEFKDWWFNIRPSNTEPYLRFLAEAKNKKLLNEKVTKVKEIVN